MPGVYLSYPFCSQKCSFCNFASGVFPASMAADYLRVLEQELADQRWPWRPETVYLGGGTPSSMDPEDLARLLAKIPGRPWVEATLESAPGTIDLGKARAWREMGLDRVSLGVQSFVREELARTGRRHDAAMVESDVAILREAGFEHINIDLIAGLPAQTRASWRESLQWIERLAPDHVSVYLFEIDEDSRLGREVILGGHRYGADVVPNDDTMAELYETAVSELARMGIARYEISNFARPGCESHHNLKYWLREPYLGFGADAHSFDGTWRWQNPESMRDYVGRKEQPERTQADAREEHFFVGLRLSNGIEPEPEEWQAYQEPIRRFVSAGLLETDGRRLRLSDRGVLLSNEVLQEFVTA